MPSWKNEKLPNAYAGPEDAELFRLLVDSAKDYAIFTVDLEGKVSTWNSGAERIFGYPEAEILGQSASIVFTPEDVADGVPEKELSTAAAKGQAEDERWHLRRDGSRFWASGMLRPLTLPNGEITGFVKVARDYTSRRLYDEQLRIATTVSRALVDQSPFSIQILSPSGKTLSVNAAWEQLWGLTLEQISDYNMLEDKQLIDTGVMPYIRKGFNGESATIPPILYDPNKTIHDGSSRRDPQRWVRAFIYPVKDQEGNVLEVVLMHEDITEQKRAADSLRESEERFERLVELSPDAIVVHSEGKVVFINTSGARLLHAPDVSSIVGMPILDLIDAEYHEIVKERMSRLSQGTDVSTIEMKFIRLDGSELYGEVISVPFIYQDRPAAQVVVRDVSERRRLEEERRALLEHEQGARAAAEHALTLQRRLEDRLMLLAEASQILLGSPGLETVQPAVLELSRKLISADAYAIWRVDADARVWRIVAQAGMSDGYREQIIGQDTSVGHLLNQPLLVEDVSTANFLTHRQELYEGEGIRSLLVMPLRIHGNVSGTLTFYYRQPHQFDETEVRVASALSNLAGSAISSSELYEEQRRLRAEGVDAERRAQFLAEASSILASTLDYEKTLAQVAQLAVPDLADWCAVDIVGDKGSTLRLAVAHADPDKVKWARELEERYPADPNAPRGVPNVLRTGKSELYAEIHDEMLVAGAVNEEHLRVMREIGFSSAMVVPLAVQGRVLGAITFVTAESGRHYRDSDLIFAEDLARRAATAIDNARLYGAAQEARKTAEQASRLKDEFLATVSHELRTPLTSVLGWAHILRSGKLEEAGIHHALETIERNARSQAQLVDDLLDVSRIISGNLRLEVKVVEPAVFIDEALAAVGPAAAAKGVEVRKFIDPDVKRLAGDPARLQQIVWNLLSNSIKFTPRGGVVSVSLARVESHIELVVNDSGQGIPAQFLPHVFDRFRQEDQSTTRSHGGLGLGLAIVRHLVELHGGTVTAESEGQGTGATFTVKLPLLSVTNDLPSARPENSSPAFESAADSTERLEGVSVLVVDDELDTRELLKVMLQRCGATVNTSPSVREALLAMERELPDVIVSDIGMPGEDGYELIRRLRALPVEQGGDIPVVALTAYARAEDRTRVESSGFQTHLAKPVELNALVHAISELARR